MNLPVETVDIPYVSKQGWSLFCPQGELGLVSDTVEVILQEKWEGGLQTFPPFLDQEMELCSIAQDESLHISFTLLLQ